MAPSLRTSDSALHPECCTSTKVTVSLCVWKFFLVCKMSLSCQNKQNSLCYICSEVILRSWRNPLSKLVRKTYELYLGCEVRDEGKFLGFEDLLQLMFEDFGRHWIKKENVCLFKAKISQYKWGQDERMNFCCSNASTLVQN